MSREIKFRLWDTGKKHMLGITDGCFYYGLEGITGISTDIQDGDNRFDSSPFVNNTREYPDEPVIVMMQFTGLKDKDGKEIYEGDVVRVSEIWKGVVEFDNGSYYFRSKDNSLDNCWLHMFFHGNMDVNEFEVIGNVWENSELVKEDI